MGRELKSAFKALERAAEDYARARKFTSNLVAAFTAVEKALPTDEEGNRVYRHEGTIVTLDKNGKITITW